MLLGSCQASCSAFLRGASHRHVRGAGHCSLDLGRLGRACAQRAKIGSRKNYLDQGPVKEQLCHFHGRVQAECAMFNKCLMHTVAPLTSKSLRLARAVSVERVMASIRGGTNLACDTSLQSHGQLLHFRALEVFRSVRIRRRFRTIGSNSRLTSQAHGGRPVFGQFVGCA